jgi:hypothetical protein
MALLVNNKNRPRHVQLSAEPAQEQPLFENGPRGARVSRKRIEQFYQTVAADPLILRSERSEPRAVKRRPKNYRLLTKPRPVIVVEPSRKQSQKPSKPCLI